MAKPVSKTRRLPSTSQIDATVQLFAALAHPIRVCVLSALGRRGPLSVAELQELADVEQSAMSHQLKHLREANLVVAERRGRQVIYSVADEHVACIVEDAIDHASELGATNRKTRAGGAK